MKTLPFYILDVFAPTQYSGNQLAVFPDSTGLDALEMQQIAREINFAETTFIQSTHPESGGYPVRIFTPVEELPFAGHPVLGTAEVIRRAILKQSVDQVILDLKVGLIPVRFVPTQAGPEVLWMRQNTPVFETVIADSALVAQLLSLDVSDIDPRYPIQEVSTGLPFVIVPVRSLEAVKKARIDQKLLKQLTQGLKSKGILIFTTQTYQPEHQLNVRVFVDEPGIPEDPATGSANGCLAGYLVKHRFYNAEQLSLQAEQGYEIGRPALLYLQAADSQSGIEIQVGGQVHWVAKGEWISKTSVPFIDI